MVCVVMLEVVELEVLGFVFGDVVVDVLFKLL